MQQRKLGSRGPRVSALGLGCMGMSDMYGRTDRNESIATIHAALDAGITLLDTGDFYGMGHNEMLLGEALVDRPRDSYQLSVKFGAQRGPDNSWLGYDARPAAVKTALAYSLKRLRTDYVDVYRPARLDPQVPIEDTAGAIADLAKAGYVRHFGLSEMGAQTIQRANSVLPVCDLQIEYSVISRGIEDRILPACRELGIGITAYGVLARGLISGHWNKERGTDDRDFRAHNPRFQGDNLTRNLALVEVLRELAEQRGVSVAQLVIAWVLARGSDMVPIPGTKRRSYLEENLAAATLRLAPAAMARLDATLSPEAIAGPRYNEQMMAYIDR